MGKTKMFLLNKVSRTVRFDNAREPVVEKPRICHTSGFAVHRDGFSLRMFHLGFLVKNTTLISKLFNYVLEIFFPPVFNIHYPTLQYDLPN